MKHTRSLICLSLCLALHLSGEEAEPSIRIVAHTTAKDGHHQVVFGDSPRVTISLDRAYSILALGLKGRSDVLGYVLSPSDDESSLSISFGEPLQSRSDAQISQSPGFTKIGRRSKEVGTESLTFRIWSDASHIYADAVGDVLVSGGAPNTRIRVALEVTANSPERMSALMTSLKSLRFEEPNQSPQRNAGSRPSSDDSSASETPSSPGPRG